MTCSTSPQAEHRRQHLASEEPTYLAAAEYFFKLLTIFLPAPILIGIGTIVERVSWRVHPVAYPPCRIHMSQSLHLTSLVSVGALGLASYDVVVVESDKHER